MLTSELQGLEMALSLPSVMIKPNVAEVIKHLCTLYQDKETLAGEVVDYLLTHGDDTYSSKTFSIGKRGNVDAKELRSLLATLKLAVVVTEGKNGNAQAPDGEDGEEAEAKPADSVQPSTSDEGGVALSVHPSGSIARAVATGYALRLLIGLQTQKLHSAVNQLEPSVQLQNEFYVGDAAYRSVDEAVKGASKRLHMSVASLPDSVFFDVAEGVCLYNKQQYWSLMATADLPLGRQTGGETTPTASCDSATTTEQTTEPSSDSPKAEKPAVRLMLTWRKKWFTQLEAVRRILQHRDYGAFFADSPYLTLAGRFYLDVPEFPPLRPEDRQGSVFEDILRRVDRSTIQRFIAFLQKADRSDRCEFAVRQAKAAGVIRAIGDAIGSIRTPIKTVDLCFQALTVIAQHTVCNRSQSLMYGSLYPAGFAGDLLEHGFVTGSGRGGDEPAGVTIPALITKNFLHRRDAWAVLSQLHPSFVHINERLVQEAARRALPSHFAATNLLQQAEANASPTHYKSSEDLFMVASATVILSHAITNPNAKRPQLSSMRPCLRTIVQNIHATVAAGHCKISGWDAQQTRLGVASIRIVGSVVRDWLQHEVDMEAKAATVSDPAADITAPPADDKVESQPSAEVVTFPTLLATYPTFSNDLATIIREAPAISCLVLGAVEALDECIQSAEFFERSIGPTVTVIIDAIRNRFIDDAFDDDADSLAPKALAVKEEIVKKVALILCRLCLQHNNADAGSILVSLGVHHCADWGLEITETVNRELAAAPASAQPAFATRLATTMVVVYRELLTNADVTAIAATATALGELVRTVPTVVHTFGDLLVTVADWLNKPLTKLIEMEEVEDAAEENEQERHRSVLSRRNTVLCSLLEVAKTMCAELPAQSNEIVEAFVALAETYIGEVPYLNQILQCIVSLAAQGAKKAAFLHVKQLSKTLSEASKASAKLISKLLTLLGEAPKTSSAATGATAAPAADKKDKKDKDRVVVSGGETTDRMEYLENSQNIFQRLVATPSATASTTSKSVPVDGGQPSVKQTGEKHIPKGFTLITSHKPSKAASIASIVDVEPKKKTVRSSEGKARDAMKRTTKPQTRDRDDERDDSRRTQHHRDPAQTRDFDRESRPAQAQATAAPAEAGNKKLVSVRGDADGINLDFLTVKIERSLAKQPAPAVKEEPKPRASWATVAKNAKTKEERESEERAAEREEEERLMRLAQEKADLRRKAQQEQDKKTQTQTSRLQRFEEEVRRNRGAIDPVDSPAAAAPIHMSSRTAPAAVDVHALLNRILPKPANVVKSQTDAALSQHRSLPGLRLATIDDDIPSPVEVERRPQVPASGSSSIAASLAQLRIGGDIGPRIHMAAESAARPAPQRVQPVAVEPPLLTELQPQPMPTQQHHLQQQQQQQQPQQQQPSSASSLFAAFHEAHQQVVASHNNTQPPTSSLTGLGLNANAAGPTWSLGGAQQQQQQQLSPFSNPHFGQQQQQHPQQSQSFGMPSEAAMSNPSTMDHWNTIQNSSGLLGGVPMQQQHQQQQQQQQHQYQRNAVNVPLPKSSAPPPFPFGSNGSAALPGGNMGGGWPPQAMLNPSSQTPPHMGMPQSGYGAAPSSVQVTVGRQPSMAGANSNSGFAVSSAPSAGFGGSGVPSGVHFPTSSGMSTQQRPSQGAGGYPSISVGGRPAPAQWLPPQGPVPPMMPEMNFSASGAQQRQGGGIPNDMQQLYGNAFGNPGNNPPSFGSRGPPQMPPGGFGLPGQMPGSGSSSQQRSAPNSVANPYAGASFNVNAQNSF